MASDVEPEIEIRAIQPGDRLTGLKTGEAQFTVLKTFLQKHAHSYQRQSLARTYAGFTIGSSPKVVGYITLVCGEVSINDGDDQLVSDEGLQYLYNQYPAVKIARLAVHTAYRRKGLGEALVSLGLGIARSDICPNVGCRFVMVDSKREAVTFYKRVGFTMLDTETNKARDESVMFIDLAKAI